MGKGVVHRVQSEPYRGRFVRAGKKRPNAGQCYCTSEMEMQHVCTIEVPTTYEPARTEPVWPAPGSEDTELGVLMEPEVGHGETEVYPRVQA